MTGVTEWLEPLEIEFELTRDGRCYFADSQPLVIELLDYWSLKYWIFRHLVVFARQLGNMMCYWLCVFKCMNVPYIWYDDIHDFTNTKLMRRRNASWTRLETWRIMLVQPKGIGGSFCLCPDWCLWLSHVIVLIVWNHGSHINNMFFTASSRCKIPSLASKLQQSSSTTRQRSFETAVFLYDKRASWSHSW